LLNNPRNKVSLYRSKALGEPPLLLGISVWLAVKNALSYAGAGRLAIPATGENVLLAMKSEVRRLKAEVGSLSR
jgi:xanthine dehydrogenase large subunit